MEECRIGGGTGWVEGESLSCLDGYEKLEWRADGSMEASRATAAGARSRSAGAPWLIPAGQMAGGPGWTGSLTQPSQLLKREGCWPVPAPFKTFLPPLVHCSAALRRPKRLCRSGAKRHT
jgi:hypothetical protein